MQVCQRNFPAASPPKAQHKDQIAAATTLNFKARLLRPVYQKQRQCACWSSSHCSCFTGSMLFEPSICCFLKNCPGRGSCKSKCCRQTDVHQYRTSTVQAKQRLHQHRDTRGSASRKGSDFAPDGCVMDEVSRTVCGVCTVCKCTPAGMDLSKV